MKTYHKWREEHIGRPYVVTRETLSHGYLIHRNGRIEHHEFKFFEARHDGTYIVYMPEFLPRTK